MARRQIPIQPLTKEAFKPYGDVIQVAEAHHFTINQGWAERYSNLAWLDVLEEKGKPTVGIVRSEPRPMPMQVMLMERHPLGSQAFIPLAPRPFLVVVGPAGEVPKPETLVAFRTVAGQGVNYARGVWHHPLIALDQSTDFLVIDRQGDGSNLDEESFAHADLWVGDV